MDRDECVQTFHVVAAYMHEDWHGDVSYGSDVAMLKVDRIADSPVPRLFREGMPLDRDLSIPSIVWGFGCPSRPRCTSRESCSASLVRRDSCQKHPEIVSQRSWLCVGRGLTDKWTGASRSRTDRRSLCFPRRIWQSPSADRSSEGPPEERGSSRGFAGRHHVC